MIVVTLAYLAGGGAVLAAWEGLDRLADQRRRERQRRRRRAECEAAVKRLERARAAAYAARWLP